MGAKLRGPEYCGSQVSSEEEVRFFSNLENAKKKHSTTLRLLRRHNLDLSQASTACTPAMIKFADPE